MEGDILINTITLLALKFDIIYNNSSDSVKECRQTHPQVR